MFKLHFPWPQDEVRSFYAHTWSGEVCALSQRFELPGICTVRLRLPYNERICGPTPRRWWRRRHNNSPCDAIVDQSHHLHFAGESVVRSLLRSAPPILGAEWHSGSVVRWATAVQSRNRSCATARSGSDESRLQCEPGTTG